MAWRKRFWLTLLLVITIGTSVIGCVDEGPRGPAGSSGNPGQAAEVITITTSTPPAAPLPADVGLTTRQAQPRISFDRADLPSGTQPVEIISASPGRVRVAFKLTDDNGDPVDRTKLDPLRFTISHLVVDSQTGLTQWLNYIFRTQRSPITGLEVTQPNDETNGTYENLGGWVYRYTFQNTIPDNFDRTQTHRVGIQARRRVGDQQFVNNETIDFRPDGGAVVATREVVKTENCQQCHDPFAFHGGIRREVKLCVQCHTPQNTDPDTSDPIPNNPANPRFDPNNPSRPLPNPVDFKVMIHRIHEGRTLNAAGIRYQVIGFNQTPFDFSEIEFPQDIRNCTKCHSGTTEADNFKISPSRAACGSSL